MIKRAIIVISDKSCSDLLEKYKSFFMSSQGGGYYEGTVYPMLNPSPKDFTSVVNLPYDYRIIILAGHGVFNYGRQLFELNDNQDLIEVNDLFSEENKQLIILDSCRSIDDMNGYKLPTISIPKVVKNSMSSTKTENSYEQSIQNCKEGTVILYGCEHDKEVKGGWLSGDMYNVMFMLCPFYGECKNIYGIHEIKNKTIERMKNGLSIINHKQNPVLIGKMDFPMVQCNCPQY